MLQKKVEWRGGVSPPRSPRTGHARLRASGSYHPIYGTSNDFAFMSGSSQFSWLTLHQSMGDTAPLLQPRYGPSSLLRAIPPPCPASVLGSSWGFHLDGSLCIRATGSQVPYMSPNWNHATSMPDATLTVNRLPQRLSRDNEHPPVLTSHKPFDTSSVVHSRSSFQLTLDEVNAPPFP